MDRTVPAPLADAAAGTRRFLPHRGRPTHQLAVPAIATTFLLLIGVVTAGSFVISRAAAGAEHSALLNSAYQHAATGVAAEESLERKYRLEPGPAPLAGHTAAERQVDLALDQIRGQGGPADRRLADRVAGEHAGYVLAAKKLFAAVDRHESTSVIDAVDTGQVDPVFGTMQDEIYAAATGHETNSLRQAARSRSASQVVLALDFVTLLVGLGLVVAGGLTLSRTQRRLRMERDTSMHLALHDGLTGLPNRQLFQDRTRQALLAAKRSGHQVTVMFVDLDRFKDVNDTLGHHYGDLLLGQVAERITSTLRAEDSVARLGGDEFAVLLGTVTRDEAVVAAQRLTTALQKPFSVKDILLDVEASIGIALAAPDADVETLLRHADIAMYEAKTEHAPFAVYELTRDDHTLARLGLLGDLRRGIARNELVLHYQPKVSADTGELQSVEALVRWQHPDRGLLAPDAFIPVAESTAVIHPLTAEVLRQALAQARSWRDRGWTIPVAVNISARSLHDLDFPAEVKEQLDAVGLPGSILTLELTESAIMTDPERALSVLKALDQLGIDLSIDDFGTGYSSMSYLKSLPMRELKIDRSFVKGLISDASDVVLVQSAVDLGHNLGLHVVAEGVEDEETRAMLASMGCDELQGYHISRPATAADLDVWLEQHQPATHRQPSESTTSVA